MKRTTKPPDPKLVERVARAIFRATPYHRSPWKLYPQALREDYRIFARAAIKAMGR